MSIYPRKHTDDRPKEQFHPGLASWLVSLLWFKTGIEQPSYF